MLPRKLTPGEITSAVAKIRRRYDEYVARYCRPQSLRRAFEERYLHALRSSADISSFLLAEIAAIEELIKREEDREAAAPKQRLPDESIAEKVVEENRRRIEKYEPVEFCPDASEEVRRLLGGLRLLAEEYWPALSSALRRTTSDTDSLEMLTLDSQLRFLAAAEPDGVPPLLSRYAGELRRFPRNYAMIDREEQDYILQAAFFLNDLLSVLERVLRVDRDIASAARESIDAALAYARGVVGDFRLKDLRRRQRAQRD